MGFREEAAALEARWTKFHGQVMQRVEQAVSETLDDIRSRVAPDSFDPVRHDQALLPLQATRARLDNLSNKLESAWEAIDEQLDELRDRAIDAEDDASVRGLGDVWLSLATAHRDSVLEMDIVWQKLDADGQTIVGHALQSAAASNPDLEQHFTQGIGAHALAREAGLEHWLTHVRYEHAYNRLRHPASTDKEWVRHAAQLYYQTYFETLSSLDPLRADMDIASAVAAKVAQHDAFGDPPIEQQKRAFVTPVLAAAYDGNWSQVATLVADRPHHVELSDVAEAFAERRMDQATRWAVEQLYAEEGDGEPRTPWLKARYQDIKDTVRNWL